MGKIRGDYDLKRVDNMEYFQSVVKAIMEELHKEKEDQVIDDTGVIRIFI
jgi:hypothetical protein